MPRGILFVVGTDAGVGKTTFAAALVRCLRTLGRAAVGMKPVETGCGHSDDQDLIGRDGALFHQAMLRSAPPLVLSPYRFAPKVVPALAAERTGLGLGLGDLVEAVEASFAFGDLVIVEGAHGALTPIAKDALTLDLAEKLTAHMLVVSTDRPGAVSQVLLVLEAIRRRALPITGVFLVRQSKNVGELDTLENARLIAERGGARVFATLPFVEGDEKARIEHAELHLTAHGIDQAIIDALSAP